MFQPLIEQRPSKSFKMFTIRLQRMATRVTRNGVYCYLILDTVTGPRCYGCHFHSRPAHCRRCSIPWKFRCRCQNGATTNIYNCQIVFQITSYIVINILHRNHDFETFIESFYTSGDIKKISSTVIKNSKQVYKAKR